MSLPTIHIQQARHNKKLASVLLLLHLPFKDWIVTACFYAAVHLAEALFYILSPLGCQHSNTQRPPQQRYQRIGNHGWRKELIRNLVRSSSLSRQFLNIYKNLHQQSTISRYLVSPRRRGPGVSINTLSNSYFSPHDIKGFLKTDLAALEAEARPHMTGIALPSNKIITLIIRIKNSVIP